MAARHKGSKGKGKGNMVAAKGSAPAIDLPGKEVMIEAKKGSSGFKKGGKVEEGMATGGAVPKNLAKAPRKAGGGATPHKAGGGQIGVIGKGLADDKPPKKAGGGAASGAAHKARGGAATMRGRSPMSSAANVSPPSGRTTH